MGLFCAERFAGIGGDYRNNSARRRRWTLSFMNRYLLFLTVGMLSSGAVYADTLKGKIIPPYPKGLESNSSACIAHSLGLTHACDYSVSDLSYTGKAPHAILVRKKVGVNADKPVWKVTDQIDYPPVKQGEFLSIAICRLNGELDHTVLAVVAARDEEWLKASAWAGKVDLQSGEIVKISPKNVECENGSWGI